MKKILLIGKEGQIGWELQRTLTTVGDLLEFDRQGFDLVNHDLIRKLLREIHPDIIVNAAAYTAVDKAETEKELAMLVNGIAPGILAEEAKQIGAIFVHYSTDYVFDGEKKIPYTEEDPVHPLNYYGESKLAGERAIEAMGGQYLIFRTSWIYSARRKNFLTTMLNLGKEKESLRIVQDEYGTPTWSRIVAEATAQILVRDLNQKWGLYHLSCQGETSRYNFVEAIFELSSQKPKPLLQKILSREYASPVKRPAYSALSNEKLMRSFDLALPDWEKALALCLNST